MFSISGCKVTALKQTRHNLIYFTVTAAELSVDSDFLFVCSIPKLKVKFELERVQDTMGETKGNIYMNLNEVEFSSFRQPQVFCKSDNICITEELDVTLWYSHKYKRLYFPVPDSPVTQLLKSWLWNVLGSEGSVWKNSANCLLNSICF